MQARTVTKTVVRQMINFSAGSAALNVVNTATSRTKYPSVNLLIDVSAFVTGWFAGDALAKPIAAEADAQIDDFFEAYIESPTNLT